MSTWTEKLHAPKVSQTKRLEKSIAGIPAGAMMYISTPQEIDAYIQRIPVGQCVSVGQMRADLATLHQADCTCPLTTGIFLRIVAEAAFENIHQRNEANPTPFWRVLEPKASLVKKLSFDGGAFIQTMREAEGIAPLSQPRNDAIE